MAKPGRESSASKFLVSNIDHRMQPVTIVDFESVLPACGQRNPRCFSKACVSHVFHLAPWLRFVRAVQRNAHASAVRGLGRRPTRAFMEGNEICVETRFKYR